LKLLRILPAYAINGISVALGMGLLNCWPARWPARTRPFWY
jgi:hypothetical protein